MLCKRCPHLVRHGQLADDQKSIEFRSLCGLAIKQALMEEGGFDAKKPQRKGAKKAVPVKVDMANQQECLHHPFPKVFDYIECSIYQGTFKSSNRTNDVIPTKDFQYSDALSGSSITDMELL
ncbi:hypothetical protein [Pseudobacteriovorax antillogorgiicola]|uniref:Uncharacterized protein n=1 Tax=Pseudobacteriovorax antillogorgiicola TaxID=1513793 RepID=A0A1Y6BUN3_9BACT|nr:hypothetical protein [Pseudobacteriovorax antillogorgiicola]TCS53795.1 hypothetical protein EDD56_107104 [Pseudobacteriovorax antillogorgiicola]SMF22176.1 hypothetical protein SAMN06296036_107168 [Pseudobacteriovorax antillogorgiicola]